jgi:hypothetical protein
MAEAVMRQLCEGIGRHSCSAWAHNRRRHPGPMPLRASMQPERSITNNNDPRQRRIWLVTLDLSGREEVVVVCTDWCRKDGRLSFLLIFSLGSKTRLRWHWRRKISIHSTWSNPPPLSFTTSSCDRGCQIPSVDGPYLLTRWVNSNPCRQVGPLPL